MNKTGQQLTNSHVLLSNHASSDVTEEEKPSTISADRAEGASKDDNNKDTGNALWENWTSIFRATRRVKNDLVTEESVDANVERHMTLPTKRSLLDDSDSDDGGGNCHKMAPRHPPEFLPAFSFMSPHQVAPLECSPDALPICTLRRYGHDEFDDDDVIPPPLSFHRHPSKKRAIAWSTSRKDCTMASTDGENDSFSVKLKTVISKKEGEHFLPSFSEKREHELSTDRTDDVKPAAIETPESSEEDSYEYNQENV